MKSTFKPYIYADNAATTKLSPTALEAMMPYLTTVFGNPGGIHTYSREAACALRDARNTIAQLLGAANPGELYFTSSGTEADNWVVRGAVARLRDMRGPSVRPKVIASAIEHHAILETCQSLSVEGVDVVLLPVDPYGLVNPADLEYELARGAENVALVSVMLANNEIGTIQPIRELADIAHAHGVPIHTDAVQAVGHIPVNAAELDVDALSLSAHKFHGPRGVGALYLRESFSIPALLEGGAQERGLRSGTENVAGAVGAAAALSEACANLEKNSERVARLRNELVAHITSTVEGVHLTGDPIKRLPSIASFVCDGVDGEMLVVLLDKADVAAATGAACSTGSTGASHVLTALGLSASQAKGALRLSLADDIATEDIQALKERVPDAIMRARNMSSVL